MRNALKHWHAWIRQRLQRRAPRVGSPDLHQAKMRFAVLVACVLYGAYIGIFEGGLTDAQTLVFTLDAFFFGLFALYTYRHFKRHPAPEYWRRSFGLVADHGAALGCLAVTGADAGALAWLPLFIIQGVGIRFGVRWLFVSQAIGLVSVGLICAINPFFGENHTIALGAALAVLVLPLYFALLAKREANIKAELVAARQEAEDANDAQRRFTAMVSHELRTPLTGISGLNEVLREQDLPDETKQLLAEQHSATLLMLNMVNDILDLSKVEEGQMQPQAVDFDLQQLATDVFQALCFQADRKGIATRLQLEPPLPSRVNGSPFHVSRILQNLLGNAIKFTAEGAVTLRISRVIDPQAKRLFIEFEIIDTGIGIPAEALPKVFDRFYQVDPAVTRRFGGTGLGTSLVKEFCDLLGGQVTVESKVGEGSRFIVTLPFETATSDTDTHTLPATTAGQRKHLDPGAPPTHVLIVEDTPTIQLFMRATLDTAGFNTKVVGDGTQALTELAKTPFDVIVMDWNMPERDGISVLTELRRERGPNSETPVVFATAAASQHLTDLALQSGAQSVLSKPFAGAQLVEAVLGVLNCAPNHPTPRADQAANDAKSDRTGLQILDRSALEGPTSMLSKLDPKLLVATFVKDAEKRKSEFELAAATRNLALFRSAIHSSSGYASTYGARRLAHLLMTAPKDENDFRLRGNAIAEEICTAFDLTNSALQEWVASRFHAAA